MGAWNLIPLVVLFAVVGGVAWIGYQVSFARTRARRCQNSLLTWAPIDVPLHQRTRRARRAQAGEEERRLHQGRRQGRSQGSQRRKVRGQDTKSLCQDVECCAGQRVSLGAAIHEAEV
jgi:hypothetical protein